MYALDVTIRKKSVCVFLGFKHFSYLMAIKYVIKSEGYPSSSQNTFQYDFNKNTQVQILTPITFEGPLLFCLSFMRISIERTREIIISLFRTLNI